MNVLERNPSRWYAMLVAGGIALTVAAQSRAAEPSKDAAPNSATAKADDGAKAADTKPAETKALKGPLDAEQKRLADRYTELEKSMNRMAEVIGQTDPKQASLLRQAFAQSRQKLLDDRFTELVTQLKKDQLFVATKGQVQVQQDLTKLLEPCKAAIALSKRRASASNTRNSSPSSKS